MNIATLIQNHPDIIPQIEKFQSVQQERQGYYSIQETKNVFDYNYELDTKSMDVILNSPIPLVFAGYRVHTLISEILIWLV
jgi:pyrimidine-specific ribonucleoside hydrolase